jgi:hypothetical protein
VGWVYVILGSGKCQNYGARSLQAVV